MIITYDIEAFKRLSDMKQTIRQLVEQTMDKSNNIAEF